MRTWYDSNIQSKVHVLVPFHSLNFKYHKSSIISFPKSFILIFYGYHGWKGNLFTFSNLLYFVWAKINIEKDIFILAGAVLKVMCILELTTKLLITQIRIITFASLIKLKQNAEVLWTYLSIPKYTHLHWVWITLLFLCTSCFI